MKKARAMYIPAGGKKAVWGPIDQNVLPEGYPYKEQSETALFEKQTLAFRSMSGFGIAQTTAIPAEAGKEYIVSFDGEIYRCAAFMAAGMSGGETPTVGNAGQLGGEDTGEPFLIAFANNKTEVYCFVAGETHELQISVMSETIHPMAPEFLPEGVGGGGDSTIPMIFDPSAGTFSCDLTFDEALEMGSAKLARLLELRLSGKEVPVVSCTGVWKNQTSTFGVHFCIEFGGSPVVASSTTYTDGEKIVVVWHTNGIAMLTAS